MKVFRVKARVKHNDKDCVVSPGVVVDNWRDMFGDKVYDAAIDICIHAIDGEKLPFEVTDDPHVEAFANLNNISAGDYEKYQEAKTNSVYREFDTTYGDWPAPGRRTLLEAFSKLLQGYYIIENKITSVWLK